jgi:RNA-binding protein
MPKTHTAEEPASADSPSKRLRALRARAHALKPVVRIASTGVTDGVMRELDRALTVHELVKIHADIDERRQRAELLLMLCESLGAEPVQTIGKMLVAFRARPQPEAATPASSSSDRKPRKRRSQTRASTTRPSKRPRKRARTAARRI